MKRALFYLALTALLVLLGMEIATLVTVLATAFVVVSLLLFFRRVPNSKEQFAHQQEVYGAAHMVHETRASTAEFFARNPDETFSSVRGKMMLMHHLAKYEAYLEARGVKRDGNVYHDAYWAQVEKLTREGGNLRVLPSPPSLDDRKHRVLHLSR
jgi:citrate synthase